MAHLHVVADNDLYFQIDSESRAITYEGEGSPIISHTDHNSEYFTFSLPRYIEGHDMLQCDVVQVHYMNISSENNISRNNGIYEVKDLQLDPEDDTDSTLLCTWLISQNATLMVGSLSFALRFACSSGSKIDYSWNTGVYSAVTISPTIDNSQLVIEQYADIIQQWYEELVMASTMGVNVVVDAKDKALDEIAKAEQDAIDHLYGVEVIHEVEQEVLDNIRAVGAQSASDISSAGATGVSNIETAEADAIANILAAEATMMEQEREELIAEVLDRVILTGTNYYLKAEGVSV